MNLNQLLASIFVNPPEPLKRPERSSITEHVMELAPLMLPSVPVVTPNPTLNAMSAVSPTVYAQGAPKSAGQYASTVNAAAQEYGVDPRLMTALFQQESGFNPRAVSSAGAKGIGQLMPGTAKGLGVKNVFDPVENIRASTRLLAGYLKSGYSPSLALAAYNAGPGAVKKYGGIPPYKETQNYVRSIRAIAKQYGYAF